VPSVTAYRRTNLVARAINGETVVLDTRARKIHRLNATASLIWQCCDGNSTADMIAAAVAEHFDCHVHDVFDDVHEALRQLTGLGLIEAAARCAENW
jgi:hypothetical protein